VGCIIASLISFIGLIVVVVSCHFHIIAFTIVSSLSHCHHSCSHSITVISSLPPLPSPLHHHCPHLIIAVATTLFLLCCHCIFICHCHSCHHQRIVVLLLLSLHHRFSVVAVSVTSSSSLPSHCWHCCHFWPLVVSLSTIGHVIVDHHSCCCWLPCCCQAWCCCRHLDIIVCGCCCCSCQLLCFCLVIVFSTHVSVVVVVVVGCHCHWLLSHVVVVVSSCCHLCCPHCFCWGYCCFFIKGTPMEWHQLHAGTWSMLHSSWLNLELMQQPSTSLQ